MTAMSIADISVPFPVISIRRQPSHSKPELPEYNMSCETTSHSIDLIVDTPAKSFAHIMK
jgi:hypothetical protein